MTILLFANNAKTTLAAPISSATLTATLQSGTGSLFPNPSTGQGFYLTFVDAATGLINEIVLVTARTGDTITIVRGQDGTTAKNWLAGDTAAMFPTGGTQANMVQEDQLQKGIYTYGTAGGTANALTATITSQLATLPDGFNFIVKASNTNTGASTLVLTLGSTILSSAPIVKGNNIPLSGGDITTNYPCQFTWSAGLGAYVMQNPATGFSQVNSVVGDIRNGRMNIAAASSNATFTADEIIVETSLGGTTYQLANYSQSINLAATGAGGMDAGSPPANGYVGIYAIFNPSTGATSILATNTTSIFAPSIYGGSNMPAGYTASALISVWRTASSQLVIGYQKDRWITFPNNTSFQVSNYTTSPQSGNFDVSGVVPINAYCCAGNTYINTQGYLEYYIKGVQTYDYEAYYPSFNSPFPDLTFLTPQTLFYYLGPSTPQINLTVEISSYRF